MKQRVVLCITALAVSAFTVFPAGATEGSIRILITSGEGSINNIVKKRAQSPQIKAVDRNDAPVAGADVTFALPTHGPSGEFVSGKREYRTRTDEGGEASAETFRPNGVEGRFFITVTVTKGDNKSSIKIPQTNSSAGGVIQ